MSSDYSHLMRYVVLGEALIDLIHESTVSPAESRWSARSGGSPMNVATALGKLGKESHFLGRISRDAFGEQLLQHLQAHGVEMGLTVRTDDPTTLAVVSLDHEGKASYHFHTQGTSNLGWAPEEMPELRGTDWLHFGSFGAVIEPSYEVLKSFIGGHTGPKSFDINARPTIIPNRENYLAKVEGLLTLMAGDGNIVKASDEDLEWLGGQDASAVAKKWCKRFELPFIIVTLGGDGVAVVGAEGEIMRHAGFKIDVEDTVGAGDTFMAGFLAKIPDGDLATALEYGSAAAAIVCTRAGAQPPTRDEVSAFLPR